MRACTCCWGRTCLGYTLDDIRDDGELHKNEALDVVPCALTQPVQHSRTRNSPAIIPPLSGRRPGLRYTPRLLLLLLLLQSELARGSLAPDSRKPVSRRPCRVAGTRLCPAILVGGARIGPAPERSRSRARTRTSRTHARARTHTKRVLGRPGTESVTIQPSSEYGLPGVRAIFVEINK